MPEFDNRIQNMNGVFDEWRTRNRMVAEGVVEQTQAAVDETNRLVNAEIIVSAAAMMLPQERPLAERLEEVRGWRFALNLNTATRAPKGDDDRELERTVWMLNNDAQRLPKTAVAVSALPFDVMSGKPEAFILTDSGVSVVMDKEDVRCETEHNDLKFDSDGKLTIPMTGMEVQTYPDGKRAAIDKAALKEPLKKHLERQLVIDIAALTAINTESREDLRYQRFIMDCQLDNKWDKGFVPLDLTDAEPVVGRINQTLRMLGPRQAAVRIPDGVQMFPEVESSNCIIANPVEEANAYAYFSDIDCTSVTGSLERVGIRNGLVFAYMRDLASRNDVFDSYVKKRPFPKGLVLASVRLSPAGNRAGRDLILPKTEVELQEFMRMREQVVALGEPVRRVRQQLPRRGDTASAGAVRAANMTIDTVDMY